VSSLNRIRPKKSPARGLNSQCVFPWDWNQHNNEKRESEKVSVIGRRVKNPRRASNRQFAQRLAVCLMVLGSGLFLHPTSAYEVWMGTHKMSSELATEPTNWARTAAWVDGYNFNIAPSGTNVATRIQRSEVISRINHVGNNVLYGVARSAISSSQTREATRTEIRTSIQNMIATGRRDGAAIKEFMLYDERGSDGFLHAWSDNELQTYREELNSLGQQNAKMIWRATNGAQVNLQRASMSIFDGLLIEGSADRFINNRNNVNTLAKNFWNRSSNRDKNLYLQIPRSENSDSQYQATREAVLEMQNVIGINGVRSDRLVVMPVTYRDNPKQVPETTNNGTRYPNTMPGIQLSLIEQRPYFEGRMGPLPANFAASTARIPMSASIASAADGSLRRDKSNGAVDGQDRVSVLNSTSMEVGKSGGGAGYDRAAVMPFELPNFGDVDNPFLSAHFEGFLTETATQDGLTAALYGLDRRSTAAIFDSDYFGLTDNVDPNATLLQDEFLTWDMDENAPFFSTSGGNEALLAFLNEQYAGGAGAGDYVFLRINTNENSGDRWSLASGNSADESRRPQLRFISSYGIVTIPEPTSLGFLVIATSTLLLRRRRS